MSGTADATIDCDQDAEMGIRWRFHDNGFNGTSMLFGEVDQ